MGIKKLRELATQVESYAVTGKPTNELLSLIAPLLLEVVHEFANLETMVAALERRLDKLENAKPL
jgi:hypothetical protein